jgi:tetratricopeptide (TPR) repeat protein
MIPAARLLSTVLFAAAIPAFGADERIRLSTPNFEFYSPAGNKPAEKTALENKGRDALFTLEQVRAFVLQSTHASWDQAIPVRVVSFQSDKQFKPYAPANATGSYSSSNQDHDYFVMLESDPDHLPIAIHDYTHLVLRHTGLKLPTWLSEGWAELFTTLKPAGASGMVGDVLKDHVEELKSVRWLDFNTLTSVNENSPSYNETNRAGQFYAESWALVHMLYLGRDYRDNFGKLLIALDDGKTASEAWQIAYGRSMAQVYADLQAYVKQNSLVATALPVELQKSVASPAVSAVSELDSGVLLADLLVATNQKVQAKAAYDKLAKQFPGAWQIAESLGYLAWQSGDDESARAYFEQALPGTTDPQMCYHLAGLYHDAGVGGDKPIATLTRAVSLKPDYAEARLQLGILYFNKSNYAETIRALAPIERISPAHAATLYGALAYACAQTGDYAGARKNLDLGRKWNKTQAEKRKAADLAEFLDSREAKQQPAPQVTIPAERPTLSRADGSSAQLNSAPGKSAEIKKLPGGLSEIEGEADALECDGPHPRLVVLTGAGEMTFEVTDPGSVTVRHEGGGHFEFVCGPMKRFHVVIDYLPAGNPGQSAAGALRAIGF